VGIKRGLVLATAVAALGVPLFAGSAHATTGNGTADCALNGQAWLTPPSHLTGSSSGTYAFTSFLADCVVSDATDSTVVADLRLDSGGSYTSTMCGTGTLVDSDASVTLNQTVPSGKLGDEFPVTNIAYTLNYNSGNGELHLNTGGISSSGHSFDTTNSKGLIQLVPAPRPQVPAVNECTDGVSVTGKLHLEY
jgi:hypothetical protein